jgi:chromosome segregation ATPase
MAAPSLKVKLIIGGIGGLAPILTKLIILDADTIASYLQSFDPKFWELVGYLLWSCILFSAGVFWAFIHKSENNLLKLFQLGIVAPAMITGIVQSSQLKAHNELMENAVNEKEIVEPTEKESITLDTTRPKLMSLISTAYANDTRAEIDKKPRTIWNQLIDGALARPVDINIRTVAERLDSQEAQLRSEKSKVLSLERNVSRLEYEIDELKMAEGEGIRLLQKTRQLEASLKESEEEKASIQSELNAQLELTESLKNNILRLESEIDDLNRSGRDLQDRDERVTQLETQFHRDLERLEGESQRVRERLEECRRAVEKREAELEECRQVRKLQTPRDLRTLP